MELLISTRDAIALKDTIIGNARNGYMKTWRVVTSKDGEDLLTHSPTQWDEKVLLRFDAKDSTLTVSTTYWRGRNVPSDDDRGYYLGRFVEVLLTDYRNSINSLTVNL